MTFHFSGFHPSIVSVALAILEVYGLYLQARAVNSYPILVVSGLSSCILLQAGTFL